MTLVDFSHPWVARIIDPTWARCPQTRPAWGPVSPHLWRTWNYLSWGQQHHQQQQQLKSYSPTRLRTSQRHYNSSNLPKHKSSALQFLTFHLFHHHGWSQVSKPKFSRWGRCFPGRRVRQRLWHLVSCNEKGRQSFSSDRCFWHRWRCLCIGHSTALQTSELNGSYNLPLFLDRRAPPSVGQRTMKIITSYKFVLQSMFQLPW